VLFALAAFRARDPPRSFAPGAPRVEEVSAACRVRFYAEPRSCCTGKRAQISIF
jgi:hypothetical protein